MQALEKNSGAAQSRQQDANRTTIAAPTSKGAKYKYNATSYRKGHALTSKGAIRGAEGATPDDCRVAKEAGC